MDTSTNGSVQGSGIKEVGMWKIVSAILSFFSASAFGQLEWTHQTPFPTEKSMFSVTYGASQFVMVGEEGTVLTSPDGIKALSGFPNVTCNLPGTVEAVVFQPGNVGKS